jgi:hypothetical protein
MASRTGGMQTGHDGRKNRMPAILPRGDCRSERFVRIHQSLRMTPAMKAGVAKDKWSVEDMVDLLPILSYNTRPKKTG